MHFDWWTFALQTINFLVLVWLLWRFLYKPVNAVIDRRKETVDRAMVVAQKAKEEAEAAKQKYEEKSEALEAKQSALRNQIHKEMESERQKVLEEAHRAAEEIVLAGHKSLEGERKEIVDALKGEIADLAADMAKSTLKSSQITLPGKYVLEQVEDYLGKLSVVELRKLHDDVAQTSTKIEIVTAQALSDEEQRLWIATLRRRLGDKMEFDFAVDPDILGGAKLQFPHATLEMNWAAQLLKAKARLKHDAEDS